jgi:hypothetical protein
MERSDQYGLIIHGNVRNGVRFKLFRNVYISTTILDFHFIFPSNKDSISKSNYYISTQVPRYF